MTSPVLSFTGELINHWCRNYREKNDISMQNLHESSRHSGHIPFFFGAEVDSNIHDSRFLD